MGTYLRAPTVFFKIIEQRDKLKPLIEQADVRYGIKTGCNEFFYLTKKAAKSFGLEKAFLKPLVRTKDFRRVMVRSEDVKNLVLAVSKEKPELRNTNVFKYIHMGELKNINNLSTCRSRKRWYDVGVKKPSSMFWSKLTCQRHIVPFNDAGAFADCNVYEITPKDESQGKALCAILIVLQINNPD
ncbi:MAG: hypothetical protein JXC85_03450 [Candidatus Aenigmarchaeota archaeon]|nr:hypothetical protein [Candidatus Aenigmarchaeota archaeon]